MPSIVSGAPAGDLTPYATAAQLAAHEADTSSIHGITDATVLATDAEVASAVATHNSDTTSVHGITDTSALVTSTSANLTYARQDRNRVNVKDHGALGDGSTNDTAAIVAALAEAVSTGDGLYFPGGTYLTDPMTISADGFSIVAYGATLKARASSGSSFLRVTGDDFTMMGGTLDGAAVIGVSEGLGYIGLHLGDGTTNTGQRATIRDVTITRFRYHGAYVQDCPNVFFERVRFIDNGTPGGTNGGGVYAHGSDQLTFRGCDAANNYLSGYYLTGGPDGSVATLSGCTSNGNGVRSGNGAGFDVRTTDLTLTNCYAYGNEAGALSVSVPIADPVTAGNRCLVTGSIMGWSVGASIDREVFTTGIDDVVFTGNVFHSLTAPYVIRLGASSGGAAALLSGNRITNDHNSNTAGVLISRENCVLSGNMIVGDTANKAGSGVNIAAGVDGTTMLANAVRGFTYGITIASGTSDNTLVYGNHFWDCTTNLNNAATGTELNVSDPTA
jgi:ribosomal protein L27